MEHEQQLSIGDVPSSRYIVKEATGSLPSIPLPIIDLSLLSLSSKEGLEELQKLKVALSTWGCFQDKEKYARPENDIEGYGNDPILSDKQVLDWSLRLMLKLVPEDSRRLEFWPENPTKFREILSEYSMQVKNIIEHLLKAMARSLDLEEDCFLNQYGGEELMMARFNYYPVCSRPDMVLGAKSHSDGSGITVLLQDREVEGLQIFKDGQWSRVPIIPDAFVVNAGDQMQIMSNGIFKSPLHRVSVSSEKERLSLAVFHLPTPEVEIGPVQGLISEERPQQYRKLKNYSAINFECFQNGTVPLDTELAVDCKEPSDKFFHKGSDAGVLDASVPLVDVPVVDLGLLLSSASTSSQELEKLHLALSTWGCFQEKLKYAREVDSMEGYGNDMVLSEHQTIDWTDRLYLTIIPENQREIRAWPEKPENFREILHEYTMKLKQINEILLEAMARSLNLVENCFLDQYGKEAHMIARFNFYPPCPRPDLILGVKPHADASALTFLLQDKEVEGLQFLKDDEWFRVPIVPHALLVNVGDQVEIMSNGIFKSPVHRVVTNTARERNTLAVFCIPEQGKEIEPAEGLINEARPKLYKTVKDYVSIYFQNYQLGKRPIEAAVNHGMTSSFLDQVRSLTKQFFALPMEEKQKYCREVGSMEGYGTDIVFSEDQILDWTDRLYLKLSPKDQRQLKLWPETPVDFREILEEYTAKLKQITEVVLKALARSLSLEEHSFLDKYGEKATMFARFNYFPPCSKPDRALGLKPHSDGSAITIVLQDKEVEGLQLLQDDQWVRVPIIPHALLINVGDQVEIMSNGLFKSPVHRVVTNSVRERISLAVFCSPDPEKDIEPVDDLISEASPKRYKKVKDYVAVYFQYYQQGKRPIEALKIGLE
ncbi:hypothetical protein Tsubulata_044523 [Turnera subulata]|uniref:Fe2OG dioxygenase domain-containing protein n=1 Tax=Turnera subulata TaxID=218843 RepID=A0A9Q0FK14_9ROSI|nr:hypothetical protein Tsubulata_044523 [Turnera subulata]